MNKYIDGTIILVGVCSLGATTIPIAESKINEPSIEILKDIQLERLDNSLAINLRNTEIEIPTEQIKPQLQPQPKPVSDIAINIVKEFEGFKDYAYVDTDGTPVIGYGLSRIAGEPVSIGDRIEQSQAHAALIEHLTEIHRELDPVLEVELSEQQLSALASISFNVGVNAIKDSTLLRKINAEDYTGAADEFLRWDKANLRGRLVQMPGLARRREAERKLFLEQSI